MFWGLNFRGNSPWSWSWYPIWPFLSFRLMCFIPQFIVIPAVTLEYPSEYGLILRTPKDKDNHGIHSWKLDNLFSRITNPPRHFYSKERTTRTELHIIYIPEYVYHIVWNVCNVPREVHCLFLDHFLNTSTKISDQSFDFCDPFRNLGSGTEQNTTKERSRLLILCSIYSDNTGYFDLFKLVVFWRS